MAFAPLGIVSYMIAYLNYDKSPRHKNVTGLFKMSTFFNYAKSLEGVIPSPFE